MGLDGDSAVPFQIHGIQQLRLHIPIRDDGTWSSATDDSGKGGLSVIDVSDDAEISDEVRFHADT